MNLIGEIVVRPQSSVFSRDQWIQVIREHANLVTPPPRVAINPFTKDRTVVPARLDVCDVVVDGKKVGWMSWAEDDSILINVFGDTQAVIPIAQDIAGSLGGCFRAATDD
jgi:hypothetical protein